MPNEKVFTDLGDVLAMSPSSVIEDSPAGESEFPQRSAMS